MAALVPHSPPPRRSSSFASSLSSSSRGGGGTSSSALSRQGARLGIITAYKDLNLHSAAAKGNIGLVQYALANGQPVNSVLDGVLPIHAAASSGSETVVRMLIEAGADVNSPRVSRRYTREGTKSSGQSVGTRGSTPLHFAAANGHTLVLSLLLSYGADPRIAEKHGATAEQIAAQNGFLDAADLLHTYAVQLDEAAALLVEAEGNDDLGSISGSSRGGSGTERHRRRTSLRSLSGLRKKSSSQGTAAATMQVHAQRSFDALATKFAHHAHRGLGAASTSSLSVNSLKGLKSVGSSSQISLGATDGIVRPPSGTAAPVVLPAQRRRRPSLTGSNGSRPLLGVSIGSSFAPNLDPMRVRASTVGATSSAGPLVPLGSGTEAGARSPERPNMNGATRSSLEADNDDAAITERAERRRSMEVNRPLRQDSLHTGLPTLASLDMTSSILGATKPRRSMDDADPDPTPTELRAPGLLPASAPVSPTRTVSAPGPPSPKQRFYRPRQSSGLSKGSFTGGRPSLEEDERTDGDEGGSGTVRVFEDETSSPPPEASGSSTASPPEAAGEDSPARRANRPRAVSNPDSRSPLLQQLHATQYSGTRPPRSRESSATGDSVSSSSTTGSQSGSRQGANLAVPAHANFKPTYDTRARSNSASTDASSSLGPSLSTSSHDSGWSGPTFSTASTSTAPTTAPPHSPTKRARTPAVAATAADMGYFSSRIDLSNRRHLGPVYEANSPGLSHVQKPPAAAAAVESVSPTGDHADESSKSKSLPRSRVRSAERSEPASGSLGSAAAAQATPSVAPKDGLPASGSGLNVKNLKDQLAAYGKTLRAERELVEKEERERRHGKSSAPSGFTFETISTSASPVPAKARSSAPPTGSTAAPSGRGGTSGGRLLPPSPTRSRRSHSPGSSATSTPNLQRSPRASGGESMGTFSPPTKMRQHMDLATVAGSIGRASSPSSTRSGSNKSGSMAAPPAAGSAAEGAPASPVAAAGASADATPVLGQGPGGVSFVTVQPTAHSRHHHHHTSHHGHSRNGSRTARSSDKSQSDRDLASVSGGAAGTGGGSISTRNGVEEERRRREEEAQKVPKAQRTVPGRSGFVRKLFGAKEGGRAASGQ
ncbi:hypothetical protein JCM8202_002513 [Rhodotorula sphaerocarpa]